MSPRLANKLFVVCSLLCDGRGRGRPNGLDGAGAPTRQFFFGGGGGGGGGLMLAGGLREMPLERYSASARFIGEIVGSFAIASFPLPKRPQA